MSKLRWTAGLTVGKGVARMVLWVQRVRGVEGRAEAARRMVRMRKNGVGWERESVGDEVERVICRRPWREEGEEGRARRRGMVWIW